jgi:hypothetical protein
LFIKQTHSTPGHSPGDGVHFAHLITLIRVAMLRAANLFFINDLFEGRQEVENLDFTNKHKTHSNSQLESKTQTKENIGNKYKFKKQLQQFDDFDVFN